MTKKQKQQILALAVIVDHITAKPVLYNKEVREVENRLDHILANLEQSKRFFKRLA